MDKELQQWKQSELKNKLKYKRLKQPTGVAGSQGNLFTNKFEHPDTGKPWHQTGKDLGIQYHGGYTVVKQVSTGTLGQRFRRHDYSPTPEFNTTSSIQGARGYKTPRSGMGYAAKQRSNVSNLKKTYRKSSPADMVAREVAPNFKGYLSTFGASPDTNILTVHASKSRNHPELQKRIVDWHHKVNGVDPSVTNTTHSNYGTEWHMAVHKYAKAHNYDAIRVVGRMNIKKYGGKDYDEVMWLNHDKLAHIPSKTAKKHGIKKVDEGIEQDIQKHLSDDLRQKKYQGDEDPLKGHCYVAAEAAYHILGGKDKGWTPMNVQHEGDSHWFLKHSSGKILDPTAKQFKTPVPYETAKGKGFLTKQPSARAKKLIAKTQSIKEAFDFGVGKVVLGKHQHEGKSWYSKGESLPTQFHGGPQGIRDVDHAKLQSRYRSTKFTADGGGRHGHGFYTTPNKGVAAWYKNNANIEDPHVKHAKEVDGLKVPHTTISTFKMHKAGHVLNVPFADEISRGTYEPEHHAIVAELKRHATVRDLPSEGQKSWFHTGQDIANLNIIHHYAKSYGYDAIHFHGNYSKRNQSDGNDEVVWLNSHKLVPVPHKVARRMGLKAKNESIYEELDDEQKKRVDSWEKGKHEFSDHVFGGPIETHNRVKIPFDMKGGDAKIPKDVEDHLATHGYEVHDAAKGTAKKQGDNREYKIGKILNDKRTKAPANVLKSYVNASSREGANSASGHHIVITRHPYDVAGMSTNQKTWDSCMNLETGCNKHYVPKDVKLGTHIAYLVRNNDTEMKRPVARIALKPMISGIPGKADTDTILRPESNIHGNAPDHFLNTVKKWSEDNFKPKVGGGEYARHPSLYPDTDIPNVYAGVHPYAHSEDMQDRESIAHTGANVDTLRVLAKDPHPRVRKAAFMNPLMPAEELHAHHEDEDHGVRSAIAAHPNTAAQTLHKMAANHRAINSFDNERVLKYVASNDNVGHVTLHHMAGYSNQLDSAIARSKKASPELLHSLATKADLNLPSTEVLHSHIADNENTEGHTLHYLAVNGDNTTKLAVAKHPNATEETHLHLMDPANYNKSSANTIRNGLRDIPHETLLSYIARSKAASSKVRSALAEHPASGVKAAVADSEYTPDSMLRSMAATPDFNVHRAIFNNKNASLATKLHALDYATDNTKKEQAGEYYQHPDILHKLAIDPKATTLVQSMIATNQKAKKETHEHIFKTGDAFVRKDLVRYTQHPDILHKAADDVDTDVRIQAASNHNNTTENLRKFAKDKHSQVLSAVMHHHAADRTVHDIIMQGDNEDAKEDVIAGHYLQPDALHDIVASGKASAKLKRAVGNISYALRATHALLIKDPDEDVSTSTAISTSHPSVLRGLDTHPSVRTRMAAAINDKTPHTTMRNLLKDSDPKVAEIARIKYKKEDNRVEEERSEFTIPSTQHKIISHKSGPVELSAQFNPSSGDYFLLDIKKDPNSTEQVHPHVAHVLRSFHHEVMTNPEIKTISTHTNRGDIGRLMIRHGAQVDPRYSRQKNNSISGLFTFPADNLRGSLSKLHRWKNKPE